MDDSIIVVQCTVPTKQEAKKIARILIEKRMAACCSIIPNIHSIYHWQNEIEESEEVLVLIKTKAKLYQQLEKEIKMIHSYAVPEIISIAINGASSAYIDWIKNVTN